jgi:hypothetical protein
MHKLSARTARVAIAFSAIVLFGGFATYAAAQVSTKPAPQVVIPRTPTTRDHSASRSGSDDPAVHDAKSLEANDDKGGVTAGSDDPAGHDANDDKGGATVGSDDPAGHDATDDKGGNAVTPTTSAKATTPTTVDDHGGDRRGGSGSGGHGRDDSSGQDGRGVDG